MFRRSHSRRAHRAAHLPLSQRPSRRSRHLRMESLEHRRMLALVADQFELNDTVATATVLGSSPYILVQNLSIDIPADVDVFRVDPGIERRQIERVRAVRASRSEQEWRAALAGVEQAARDGSNLVPPIVTAVEKRATLGEIADTLRHTFGEYQDNH